MKLKKIMALLLVGCMAASLAACGSGEGKKNAKKGGDGPVEIDYATFMVGTHQSAEAEKKVIDEFNKKYEGKIKVNIEELPSDSAYVDKMKTLAASNALPDVVIGKEGIRELAVKNGQAFSAYYPDLAAGNMTPEEMAKKLTEAAAKTK